MTPTQKTATLCNNLHEWITTSSPQATSLWAKTGPQGTHLPLINHLADRWSPPPRPHRHRNHPRCPHHRRSGGRTIYRSL